MMSNDNYFIITKNSEEAEKLKQKGFELVSESYGTYTFIDKELKNYDDAVQSSKVIKTKMFSL